MIFTVKDLGILLDKAVEVGRDLQLSINADGTYDVYFNIPTIYTTITSGRGYEDRSGGEQE